MPPKKDAKKDLGAVLPNPRPKPVPKPKAAPKKEAPPELRALRDEEQRLWDCWTEAPDKAAFLAAERAAQAEIHEAQAQLREVSQRVMTELQEAQERRAKAQEVRDAAKMAEAERHNEAQPQDGAARRGGFRIEGEDQDPAPAPAPLPEPQAQPSPAPRAKGAWRPGLWARGGAPIAPAMAPPAHVPAPAPAEPVAQQAPEAAPSGFGALREREQLGAALREKLAAQRALRDAFHGKLRAHQECLTQHRSLRDERAKVEQAAWAKEAGAPAGGVDLEVKLPFEEEVVSLQNLVRYLGPKAGPACRAAAVAVPVTATSQLGAGALGSKADRTEAELQSSRYFVPRAKAQKHKEPKEPKAARLVHSMQTLCLFERFKIAAPADAGGCADALEATRALLAKFRAKRSVAARAQEEQRRKDTAKARVKEQAADADADEASTASSEKRHEAQERAEEAQERAAEAAASDPDPAPAADAALAARALALAELEAFVPPGDEVDMSCAVPKPKKAMAGFSARTYGLANSEGFRTPDGLHTWVTPVPKDKQSLVRARQARWTLLGDGPLKYAEIEVSRVQAGYGHEFLVGLVAKPEEFSDWHDYGVAVHLSCAQPDQSLGFSGGLPIGWSDAVGSLGAALAPGDRVGVWYTGKELRLVQNGRPLLRMRAELGPRATLAVQLRGRVSQLAVRPLPAPDVSFDLPLEGRAEDGVVDWTDAELEALGSLW